MKELSGAEIAGYVKERQVGEVRRLAGRGVVPKLVILRDNDAAVIAKYVELKKRYGEDIGVVV
jgi:5,10-methylene-tetrahydrofolate dehydrogenase/methenyl tetrahydrofolate cyclohydrolase